MEDRPADKSAYQPACVEACPAQAIIFGDVEDPTSAVVSLSSSSRAFRLLGEMGTEPKVWYLSETRE